MYDKICTDYDLQPDAMLVDNGFVKLESIEYIEQQGTQVIAPVTKPRGGRDPHVPLENDPPGVAAWRVRMGTEAAKEAYKDRASTAECVNGLARMRGMTRLLVRGIEKARACALWQALAHNLRRALTLDPQVVLGM